MKKIVLITVLAILIGGSSVFAIMCAKQKTSNSVVYEEMSKNEQKIEDNIVPEIVEESVVEEEKVVESKKETTNTKQVKENVVVQEEVKSNSTNKIEKVEKIPEETNQNENKQQEKIQQNDTKSDIEEKQEENTLVVEESKQVEKVEQEKKPEVDEEYERLMKQVEYATYEECLQAGFDIALTDTVNILGFDPIEIIYKGKVIGYKLKIRYTNPLEN